MCKNNDWRLMNQENYLKGKELYYINYNMVEEHDHDHCAFCMEKFYSTKQKGYCTTDYYHWICEKCYEDFKDIFNWVVIEL